MVGAPCSTRQNGLAIPAMPWIANLPWFEREFMVFCRGIAKTIAIKP
jgi:hypothetical protein